MNEIGGYLELENNFGKMLHQEALALNLARNCLAYLIRCKDIKTLYLPYFLCSTAAQACKKEGILIKYYSVGMDFIPENFNIRENEWVYIVNYYGQLSNETILELKHKYNNIIVDNVQAYFQPSVDGIDTIYTCRKFFGVPDGAFLYTDNIASIPLEMDVSYHRMEYILGRYEKAGSDFYSVYAQNEESYNDLPVRKMSKLTANLLHGIDYDFVKKSRTENFVYLHKCFESANKLILTVPDGAFMYPLYIENGVEIRKKLQAKKIYIPTLWPDVFEICSEDQPEYDMAMNILPLPIDQRYGIKDMEYLVEVIQNV